MELSTDTSILDDVTTIVNNILNMSNSSPPIQKSHQIQLRLYDILIPTFGAVIIVLNLFVVVSSGLILKKGQQPRSTYLFLGNVAMTDLITGIAVVFGQVYPSESRTQPVCAIQIGMIVSSTIASVYSVGLIAVDRFLYIIHGLQYQRWIYPLRARMLIGFAWIIGGIIGFLPLMGWANPAETTNHGKICWFIKLVPQSLLLLTVAVGTIPLITVVILYSVILYHAINKIIQLQQAGAHQTTTSENDDNNLRIFRGRGNTSDTSDVDEQPSVQERNLFRKIFTKRPDSKIHNPTKWKAIKIVMFTTGSFVITWVPYFVASTMYSFCDDLNSKRCVNLSFLIASPLAILGFVNSLINPIIYAWWHKGFRSFIVKKISIFRKNKSPHHSGTTSTNISPKTSSSNNLSIINKTFEKEDISEQNTQL